MNRKLDQVSEKTSNTVTADNKEIQTHAEILVHYKPLVHITIYILTSPILGIITVSMSYRIYSSKLSSNCYTPFIDHFKQIFVQNVSLEI